MEKICTSEVYHSSHLRPSRQLNASEESSCQNQDPVISRIFVISRAATAIIDKLAAPVQHESRKIHPRYGYNLTWAGITTTARHI